MDSEGIIRIRTKIIERRDLGDFGIPAILPSSHRVVEMHEKACHVGVQGLLSLLRERFWILKGRKPIRGILTKCVVCRRHGARHISTIPPALPNPLVRDAAAFETTNIDMAGLFPERMPQGVGVFVHLCGIYRSAPVVNLISVHGVFSSNV
jgi:hypothetical protein